MKFVRFNLSLAGFTVGQIIPYHELTPGQKFWVDNEDILGSERIAHFCDQDGKDVDPDVELEEVVDLADEPVEEATPDETAPEEVEETAGDKKLDFDFEEDGDETEKTEREPEAADETCRGIKADGSSCNNKAGDSGYCFRHISQA